MLKPRRISLLAAVGLLIWIGSAHGFPWSRDMKDQPSIKPQEAPRRPAAGTIPRDGWEPPMTREEMAKSLVNPVPITRQSVENGQRLFAIYCAHCHGANGKGMGPVAVKFIPPPDLTLPFVQQKTDGYIYGTIRNGGSIMPAHGDLIAPKERWEIVNFLRSLQQP